MRVWHYEPTRDPAPEVAEAGDLEGRRAVLVAAPTEHSRPMAWMAIDDYDGTEGTLLFGAPPSEDFPAYVRALLTEALDEAQRLRFDSLVAHWRAGWSMAERILADHGFEEAAAGVWRRAF